MYVTSSQVTPRGGRRHTVGHVTGGKAHHTTLQCCHLHALAQSNRQAAHMNLAANTMGGEHTCCRHTMPAHGSSHHGWRIITDNAGSRQLTPRVENKHMPAHGSSHHGWTIITDNAGSRQLTPRVENNHMPAHGSSHHGWRIITDNAGSRQLTPRVENNHMPAHGSSHHGWRIITDNAGSRQLTPRVENHHRQGRLTAAHTTGGE